MLVFGSVLILDGKVCSYDIKVCSLPETFQPYFAPETWDAWKTMKASFLGINGLFSGAFFAVGFRECNTGTTNPPKRLVRDVSDVNPGNFTDEDPLETQASYGLLCTWLQ